MRCFHFVLVRSLSAEGVFLLEFRKSVIDPDNNLQSWNSLDSTPCIWKGVGCSTNLKFNVSSNFFSGPIPQYLGPIPPEISGCDSLEILWLAQNSFQGSLPKELQKLQNLTNLILEENILSGEIPPEIGNISNLARADSNLVGNIPPYLCKYEKLMLLGLGSNWLFGNIHPFGLKTCKSLELLMLGGDVPRDLGNCMGLQRLDLSRNQFAGSVPEEIGKLVDVELLKISDNRLTGEIPRKLQLLESLYLNDNRLVGDVPTSFSELISLLVCNLSNNNLVGPVPHNPAFLRMDSTKFAGYNGSCKSGSYRCHPVIPIFYV
ncbi:hypothetical protein OIU78_017653 [Salix suchowensis]|nr:hypothetical protein OIU78_017653 [Salix suchowensis]